MVTKIKTQDIQEKINADKLSLRNGVYKAKWMYFYTHGATTDNYIAEVKKEFPNATIADSSNNWNAWPKDSWFEVSFILSYDELMTLDNTTQAKDPNWAGFDKQWKHIHDWRTYITDEVRANWDKIPLIGRCAIISCCEEMASTKIGIKKSNSVYQ